MAVLWMDKNRPKRLDQLDYHHKLTELLKNLAEKTDFPHLLFYGPAGAGKKTRVLAMLANIYGSAVHKGKVDTRTFKAEGSSTEFEMQVYQSIHHHEITPSDVGNKDRVVVQTLIKDLGSTKLIGDQKFRILVINDADQMSHQAQASLRRTMEKYVDQVRLVLISTCLSKVIPPLKSRCVCVRVAAPKTEEVVGVLRKVCVAEGVNVTDDYLSMIVRDTGRDVSAAILALETCNAFEFQGGVHLGAWIEVVHKIVDGMMQEQSPKKLLEVRNDLYDLLMNCIPADLILKVMLKRIIRNCKNMKRLVSRVVFMAAKYEHTMLLGQKEIYHLEAFCARFMADYRECLLMR